MIDSFRFGDSYCISELVSLHVDKLKSKYKKVKLGATPIGLTCSPGRGATTSGGDGGPEGRQVCDSQEVSLQHFSGVISNKMSGNAKIVALNYNFNSQNVSLQCKGLVSG